MLRQARMEPGLNAEQGHGMEVCTEEPPGSPWETCGMAGHSFSKLAYLASKVNTNLQPLSREGAVQ